MRPFVIVLVLSATLIGCSSQSIDTKEKITAENAHLVKDFDIDDVESLVTYYFASRIRKDDKWKSALPPSTEWSARMKGSIKRHNEWNFVEFQNLGLHDGSYVKVRFVIEIDGKRDGGEDEVELGERNGRMVITKVPV